MKFPCGNVAGVPGAPTSIRLIGITEDSVTIEWGAPSTDGGRPVTRFVVEKREARSQYWAPVASVGARTTVYQVRSCLVFCFFFTLVSVLGACGERRGAYDSLPGMADDFFLCFLI